MFPHKAIELGEHQGQIESYVWLDVDDSDDAQELSLPQHAEVSFQVFGTFGAGELDIEGTLVPAISPLADNWTVLRQLRDGELARFTAADIISRLQNVLRIRPTATNGAGPLTVIAMFSGPRMR